MAGRNRERASARPEAEDVEQPEQAEQAEQPAAAGTVRVEIMRDCWCSEASIPYLPPPATDRQATQRCKLLKGSIVDLAADDAKALHDRGFVRLGWPGK